MKTMSMAMEALLNARETSGNIKAQMDAIMERLQFSALLDDAVVENLWNRYLELQTEYKIQIGLSKSYSSLLER